MFFFLLARLPANAEESRLTYYQIQRRLFYLTMSPECDYDFLLLKFVIKHV